MKILFDQILNDGTVPMDWKMANITPIHKKDKKSEPGNYRPVSLLPVVSKLFESLLKDCIMEHLSYNNLLSCNQHGFIPGRSCVTNLLELMDKWTDMLDNDEPIDNIYLDFRKAFDSVPHRRLILKLEAYGIKGDVLNCLKSFLSNRKQRVIVNGHPSNWTDVISGVPQGSVLGPVLFIVFVNDMPSCVKDSFVSMFADDTKLYLNINSPDDHQRLQQDLHELEEWSHRWQLQFNPTKCKVSHLGSNNQAYSYTMKEGTGRILLQRTQCEKDLGVFVDDELSFDYHINQAIAKSNRILGLIRRTYTHLDENSMKTLYTSLVRPHLEYGNSVWSPFLARNKTNIERVQRRATKLIPSLRGKTYEQRLRALDLPSMEYRRLRGDVIETYKYLSGLYDVEHVPMRIVSTSNQSLTTRGHSMKLTKPRFKKSVRQHYLSNRIVNLWNSLPEEVVSARTLHTLKQRLDKHLAERRFEVT